VNMSAENAPGVVVIGSGPTIAARAVPIEIRVTGL